MHKHHANNNTIDTVANHCGLLVTQERVFVSLHEARELGTHEDGRGVGIPQASRACICEASAYISRASLSSPGVASLFHKSKRALPMWLSQNKLAKFVPTQDDKTGHMHGQELASLASSYVENLTPKLMADDLTRRDAETPLRRFPRYKGAGGLTCMLVATSWTDSIKIV